MNWTDCQVICNWACCYILFSCEIFGNALCCLKLVWHNDPNFEDWVTAFQTNQVREHHYPKGTSVASGEGGGASERERKHMKIGPRVYYLKKAYTNPGVSTLKTGTTRKSGCMASPPHPTFMAYLLDWWTHLSQSLLHPYSKWNKSFLLWSQIKYIC